MTPKKLDSLFDTLFALMLFSLPLSFALPNILLLILGVLFFFKKKKRKLNTYIKLTFILVVFILIKAILNGVFIENFELYKHLLILIPLAVVSMNIENTTLVLKGFILGVLVAVFSTLVRLGIYYYNHNQIPLGNTEESANLLIIHRPYFGFLCFLTVLFLVKLQFEIEKTKLKIANLIAMIIVILFTYLIVARLALLLVLLLLFVLIFTKLKLTRVKKVSLLGVIIAGALLLFFTNKNLQDRMHIKDSYSETIKVVSNQEPRFVIWKCAKDQIKSPEFNLIFGYDNLKSIKEKLINCYSYTIKNASKKAYYLKTKFNTHNQFFDFFLQGGIVALLLFLSLFLVAFYFFRSDSMMTLMIFGFFMFFLLENLLHRQLGSYLFGIFIPLMFNNSLKHNNE